MRTTCLDYSKENKMKKSRLSSIEAVQRKVDEKFPGRGIKVLEYNGADHPVKILCPVHGEQNYTQFNTFIHSARGCPKCGIEGAHKAKTGRKMVPSDRVIYTYKDEEGSINTFVAASKEERDNIFPITPNSNVKAMGGFRLWSSKDPLPEDTFVHAPFFKDVRFAAGDGSFQTEDNNGYQIPFGRATLHRKGINPNNVVCAAVRGDSMEPRMFDGDTIGIDRGSTSIRNGSIYAVCVGDDGLLVKQLFKVGEDRVRLHSLNPMHLDKYVQVSELHILGRVFWVSSML